MEALIMGSFILVPLAGAALALLCKRTQQVLMLLIGVSVVDAVMSALLIVAVRGGVAIKAAGELLRADAFSAWHIAILSVAVFLPSTLYAFAYFDRGREVDLAYAKRFGTLWLGAYAAMSAAMLTGNIGVMWVALEASTLFTAFLIYKQGNPASLEAMWKYIIMCSVGLALAFIGTLLMAAAGQQAGLEGSESLSLQSLYAVRGALRPNLALTAFVFILIGYGTKAGLAPMHNWLPDAHSQAPGPVSAMFSGFLLNAALYCILRFLPLASGVAQSASGMDGSVGAGAVVQAAAGTDVFAVAGATAPGLTKAQLLLLAIAMISIILSAIFIFFQRDAKRMLAYCSVEHMGIIAFAYALGPIGALAGLFHTLNHSLAKTVGFFSAGSLGKKLGTNQLPAFAGAWSKHKLYAGGFAASLAALIGIVPFSIFMSEFMLARSAADARQYVPLAIFLGATSLVFLMMSRHAIVMLWKRDGERLQHAETPAEGTEAQNISLASFSGTLPAQDVEARVAHTEPRALEALVILLPLAALAFLGLWMPHGIGDLMRRAAEALWSLK